MPFLVFVYYYRHWDEKLIQYVGSTLPVLMEKFLM